MRNLGPTVKKQLERAILLADGYGNCRYKTRDGAPSCVIGQLANIRKRGSHRRMSGLVKYMDIQWMFGLSEELMPLLQFLQTLWDSRGWDQQIVDETEARMAMLFAVESRTY